MRIGRGSGEDRVRIGRGSGEDPARIRRELERNWTRIGRGSGEDRARIGLYQLVENLPRNYNNRSLDLIWLML